MKRTVALLERGFQSSTGKTPEFLEFVKVFKKEFNDELKSIGVKDVKYNVGHFYISGFFTNTDGQIVYFSLPDVRGFVHGFVNNSNSCMNQLLYRKAKSYSDYTGGQNRYAKICFDMITEIVRYIS